MTNERQSVVAWVGRWGRPAVAALLLGLPTMPLAVTDDDRVDLTGKHPVTTEQGAFRAWLRPTRGIPAINTMHAWTLHLRDSRGQAVDNARIEIDGGMPAHDHGLPTAPRMTGNLGSGGYRLDGFRFSMAGRWQLVLHISTPDAADVLTVNFDLPE